MKKEEQDNLPQEEAMAETAETTTAEMPSEGVETTASDAGKDPLKELKDQLTEARNKYLYLFSDFENYKRNAARERMELRDTAGRDILSAMIPILDDFDRAAKNNALGEGTALIYQKLINTLQGRGLKSLVVNPGDAFNIDQHEAIVTIPAPAEELKGKIVDVIEQGYQLGDRVIRFAKVVIGE
jgi:molecular chaperone GrpE